MRNDNQYKNEQLREKALNPSRLLISQQQLPTESDAMVTSQGDLIQINKFVKDTIPNNKQISQSSQSNMIIDYEQNQLLIRAQKKDLNKIQTQQSVVKQNNSNEVGKLNLNYDEISLEKQENKHKKAERTVFDGSSSVCIKNDKSSDSSQKVLSENKQSSTEQNSLGQTLNNNDDSPQRMFQDQGRNNFRNASVSIAQKFQRKEESSSQAQDQNSNFNIDIEGFSPTVALFGQNMHRSKRSMLGLSVNEPGTPINNNNNNNYNSSSNNNSKFKVYPILQSGLSSDNIKRNSRPNRISLTVAGDRSIPNINGFANNSPIGIQSPFINLLDQNRERQFSKYDNQQINSENPLYQNSQFLSAGIGSQNFIAFQGRNQGETDSQIQYNQHNSSQQVIIAPNQQNQQQQSYNHSQFYVGGSATIPSSAINKNPHNAKETSLNWNIAIKIKNITRFLQKLRSQTSDFNKRMLKDFHHKLISDASDSKMYTSSNNNQSNSASKLPLQYSNTFITNELEEANCFERCLFIFWKSILKKCFCVNQIQSFRERCEIPVFSPEQTMIVVWNIIFGLLLLLEFFYVPFSVGFSVNSIYETKLRMLFYIMPIIACTFDSLINLNSGYYQQGLVEVNRKKIFRRFLSKFLARDIISLVSLIVAYQTRIDYISLLFFIRIPQLLKIMEETAEYFQFEQKYYNYYQLGRLLFLMLYISHFCGCIFHYISYQMGIQSEEKLKQTWLYDAGVFYQSVFVRYVNSFYFIVITMTTVGYGDIKPLSVEEKIYVTVITILGSGIFAYTVNTIGTIFQEIERKKAQSKQRKYELTSYLNQRQVKKDIQIRVLKHLEFSQQREDDDPIRGMNILENVSKNLKEEVCKDFYGRILQQNKIFNLQFSQQSLLEASLNFKEKIYSPGEIIFKEGQSNDHDIYFLYKGSIDLFVQKSRKQQRTIFTAKSGMFFGQGAFFSSAPRECSAKTISVCHLLVLSQIDFIKVLKNHQEDYEKFCVIKDEMNIYKIQQHMTCFSCGQFNHTLLNCHLIHYKRNRDLFLARHRYSIPQERNSKFSRKLYNKSSSWKNRTNVRQNLFDFRLEALHLMLQNPSEITDKQFFNGVNKIKYENGFFVIDYEEYEDVQQIKQENGDDDDEDYGEERSYSSENDENEGQVNNSLSFASILSVKSSNQNNSSQDQEFTGKAPYYYQKSEGDDEDDEIVEDALLNSIKEVNEVDEELIESQQMHHKLQILKRMPSNPKTSIQSTGSKRNVMLQDDNRQVNSPFLQRQMTHKESNASTVNKLESQRSLRIVSQSQRALQTRIVGQQQVIESVGNNNQLKATPRNSLQIDSSNRSKKSQSHSPVFIQKDQNITNQAQSYQNQKIQGKDTSSKIKVKKSKKPSKIADYLHNNNKERQSSQSSSSMSEYSQDIVLNDSFNNKPNIKSKKEMQKVVNLQPNISQFNEQKQQKKRKDSNNMQINARRQRKESIQIDSLAHIENSPEFNNPTIQEHNKLTEKETILKLNEQTGDFGQFNEYVQNNLNLNEHKNQYQNSNYNNGIQSHTNSRSPSTIIVNSHQNKKIVFQNIIINQKKGAGLSPKKGKNSIEQDFDDINDTDGQGYIGQVQRQNEDLDESILKTEGNQKEEQSQTGDQWQRMYEQLQKRRSKSVTRSKPVQKLSLDKNFRRSSVFDKNYNMPQLQLEDVHQLTQKSQLKNMSNNAQTPLGATTNKLKKHAMFNTNNPILTENHDFKNTQETTFRKVSNVSNKGQGQIQQFQLEKLALQQQQKTINSQKKVNMPLINPNEQFYMKTKKKSQLDPSQLLNQLQQFSKQENEKLIEQIKTLFAKSSFSVGATPGGFNNRNVASMSSMKAYDFNTMSKNFDENCRSSLNNIQTVEEATKVFTEVEMNDRMLHKIKTNLNYNTDLFYYDFDTLKIFKYYFPLNNYINVVARYKPKRIRNTNRAGIKRKTYLLSSNFN